MKVLPNTIGELIDELNEEYPDKCPDPKDSEREIWMKAGERRLVNLLVARKKYTYEPQRSFQV